MARGMGPVAKDSTAGRRVGRGRSVAAPAGGPVFARSVEAAARSAFLGQTAQSMAGRRIACCRLGSISRVGLSGTGAKRNCLGQAVPEHVRAANRIGSPCSGGRGVCHIDAATRASLRTDQVVNPNAKHLCPGEVESSTGS